MTRELYIGLMSGTSLDGIDAVLVAFTEQKTQLLDSHFLAYPAALRAQILALQQPTENELEKTALIGNALANLYALAVDQLLAKAQISADQIIAIGCHGQTIRHQPGFKDGIGFSLQIGNAALLTELSDISVVSDFRSRDIAAGGQGAPLVPAFHQAVFTHPQLSRAIINIGGIANITYLGRSAGSAEAASAHTKNCVDGFDTGPGNMLLDAWIKHHLNLDYDANGDWASTGVSLPALLTSLLDEPYFALAPPKSTGRDLFNANWLQQKLAKNAAAHPQDVAHTLVDLTVQTIYSALINHCGELDEVYLCGGGARNQLLVKKLQALLGKVRCHNTDRLGIGADWLEAVAFAWLAKQCMDKKTANLAQVTGAQGARILGAIYQH